MTRLLPKAMVPINGKPLLFWQIINLKAAGVKNFYITLHHLPEKITEYFQDGKKFGVSIQYFYEKKLLGTGGGLIPILKYITSSTIVLYGDIFSTLNYKKLLSFHTSHHALATAVIHKSTHPVDSDLVDFDKKNKLVDISYKPHSIIPKEPHGLAGIYVFSPNIKKYFVKYPPFSIEKDLLPLIVDSKDKIFCYNTSNFLVDIGTPDRLAKLKKYYFHDYFTNTSSH